MKRALGPVLASLTLIAGGGGVFTACVHDDSTLFVHDALAPKFSQMGSICTWTPDPMQAFIPSGVMDVALRQTYEGGFLVGNQMVPEVNSNQLQTETSFITIEGAVVRVTDRLGNVLGKPFTRLTAATIPPSSGGVPGYAPIFVTIVDQPALQMSSDVQQLMSGQGGSVRLVTYVRFFGKTTGGQSVESNEFEFPVDVCNGCLVSNYIAPNCISSAASMQSSQTQIPCIIGQDLPVDCSVVCADLQGCAGSAPITDGGAG